jgi:ADP-L-glycero-D-manno-heptose 6-epimerase
MNSGTSFMSMMSPGRTSWLLVASSGQHRSGPSLTFNKIVQGWNQILGTNFQPDYIDNPFGDTYQAETCLDISSARMIGWKPQVGLYPGLVSYRKNLRA